MTKTKYTNLLHQPADILVSRFLISFPILFLFFAEIPLAMVFTPQDRDKAMEAYNSAFYKEEKDYGYFIAAQGVTQWADFWKQAEEIEMVCDAAQRTGNRRYKEQIIRLIKGFKAHYGSQWSGNHYNDDIMWMCIASLRAYELTGKDSFRDQAKKNFDECYARAWDTEFAGGGMWWTTDKTSKNACVNGPAAIAACLLYHAYDDKRYLQKAKVIMDWEKAILTDGAGRVYDNISTNGKVEKTCWSYNAGTYIGSCNELGRIEDAKAAADFAMNSDSLGRKVKGFRILTAGLGGDGGGFTGIFMRWMAKFMRDQHLEDPYLPWLQANAEAAWNVRRLSDKLSWCLWQKPTPKGEPLDSWSCTPSVVTLQVVPTEKGH